MQHIDFIADMLCNKRLQSIESQLFIKDGQLDISLAFITQYYFVVPKHLDKTLCTTLL